MRTLNRPMFRYGGPIKEGVMHGIREPHANGGTIAGGNQIGMPMGNRTGFADPATPGFWRRLAAQYNPKNFASPKKFLQRINPFKKVKTATKVGKNLQGIFDMSTKKGITGSGTGQGFLKNLKDFSFPGATKLKGWGTKVKDTAFKYPKSTAAGAYFGGIPLATNLPYKKIASTIADVAVPDQIYNWETGRWFNSDDTDFKPGDKPTTTLDGPPGSDNPFIEKEVIKELTEAEKEAAETAARKKKMDSYREIMDIKGMTKDAAYDSLIAASQAINSSGDFKGDLKSGKLINQIIQGASKAFDKPKATKDALNSLLVKSKIASDLKAESGGPLMQQAKDMVAAGGAANIQEAMKYLSKKPAVADTAMAYAKQLGKSFIDESIATLSLQKEFGERPTPVITEKLFETYQKADGYTTVIDLFEKLKVQKKLGEGYYVIGGNGFSVDAQGNTEQVL